MLPVLITIDAEVSSPFSPGWRESRLADELRRDIDGSTPEGEFGLPYELGMLRSYGLRACVFLEALCATIVGTEPLRRIVSLIESGGHEVGLHLHPEWLSRREGAAAGCNRRHMREFDEDDQCRLIAWGLNALREAGAKSVRAFRAGNWGADLRTLRALARNGVPYDSSYNVGYLGAACGLEFDRPLLGPAMAEGVCEVPLSFFRCFGGACRPAQLCACSSEEMEAALEGARRNGQPCFTLVLHSFELVKRTKKAGRENFPSGILLRRFERLCRYLAERREQFRTAVFCELAPDRFDGRRQDSPVRANARSTLKRYAEQLACRLF